MHVTASYRCRLGKLPYGNFYRLTPHRGSFLFEFWYYNDNLSNKTEEKLRILILTQDGKNDSQNEKKMIQVMYSFRYASLEDCRLLLELKSPSEEIFLL